MTENEKKNSFGSYLIQKNYKHGYWDVFRYAGEKDKEHLGALRTREDAREFARAHESYRNSKIIWETWNMYQRIMKP